MNKLKQGLSTFYKKYQDAINISLLILLPVLIFYNSLSNYFTEVDDFNTILRSKRSIPQILTTNEYGGSSGGNYRPLEVLSYSIESKLYGDESTFGRHISNLILHLANGIFIYLIVLYLTKNKLIGLIAGLLFALHIMHSNIFSPVTWIQGRLEVLVTFFYLLTIILFLKSVSRGSVLSYLLALVSFLFALMSKEMAITLPIVVLLYTILIFPDIKAPKEFFNLKQILFLLKSFFIIGILMILLGIILSPNFVAAHFSSDQTLKQATIERIYRSQTIFVFGGIGLGLFTSVIYLLLKFSKKLSVFLMQIRYSVPFFIVLLMYMVVRFLLLGGMGGAYESSQGNVIFQVSLDAFMRDLYAMVTFFWPVALDFNIDIFKLQIENPFVFYSVSLVVTAALIYLAYKLIVSKKKILAFSFFWIFITLIPVHNILIPSWQFQAKYFYLSLAGFCIFISILLYRIKEIPSRSSNAFAIVLTLFIIILSSLFIIKSNVEKRENGEIMRGFVQDMKSYQSKITDSTSMCFISFPNTPVNTNSCMYMHAYFDEVFSYIMKNKNAREYDYSILSYVKGVDANNINIDWINQDNFTIDGISLDKYYLVPEKTSSFDEDIKKIYKTIPHPSARQINSEEELGEYSLNMKKTGSVEIKVLKYDKKNGRAKLDVELKKSLKKPVSNTLFFIYENNHFKLIKEYQI